VDVLLAYDIDTHTRAGERRLMRVAKICESYGERVQYSVFECRLSETKFERLVTELDEEIDSRTDSVCIYRFPGALGDARMILGIHKSQDLGGHWLL
jgi:CRISPR-associated protein Cas2